ncbi:hypothetical protein ACFL6F_01880 [Planctomycetota bacterium]
MKGVLKALPGFVLILSAVILFNRLVLTVSAGYIEEDKFYTARITSGAVIPFDPFLYAPSPVYRDNLTEIYTGETIRRFALFHPMHDKAEVDTVNIDTHLYDEFRDYDFGDMWKTYMSIISACRRSQKIALEQYDIFYRRLGKTPPEKDRELCEQLEMFHDDYIKRLEKKKDIFDNAGFYMEKFSQTGSGLNVKNTISLFRDFDIDFELRYEKDQPLYYIHNTLIRKAVLFQGYAINYLKDNDAEKLNNMYGKTLKPVIETLVDK